MNAMFEYVGIVKKQSNAHYHAIQSNLLGNCCVVTIIILLIYNNFMIVLLFNNNFIMFK